MSSERQEINPKDPWWGEHVHRYEWVINSLNGNESILDIACGSGFGSNLLASKTDGEVVGGDLSKEAINISRLNWNRPNLKFSIMDATNLEYKDDCFDVIVSFETIEHSVKFNEMLEEFKRVLKPSGVIYLSTPNKKINSPKGEIINPFHTQEWYLKEFKEILKKHYPHYTLYGQKYSRYKDNGGIKEQIEKFLYLRGVRKLPLSLKDKLFKIFGYDAFYPLSVDYQMVEGDELIGNCKTFFAVCKI